MFLVFIKFCSNFKDLYFMISGWHFHIVNCKDFLWYCDKEKDAINGGKGISEIMATICHKYLIKTTKSLSVDNGLLLPSFLWIWEDKTKINQIKSSVDDFVIKEDSVQRLPFTPFLFNYPKSESFIVIDWKLSIESLALVSSQPAQHWSVLLPKIISFFQ